MNTVETVLVIILSIGFLTLLILGIVLTSILIAIMRNVKRLSERAEEATSNVAEMAAMVTRRIAPLALSGVIAAAVKLFKGRKGRD